ncbi:MAG: A/G-specific adenine glycosylase [Proteobacteria bacterium]|nr:A/G-specific adenine glycosylase [Pseudomonadota bacterium]MBU1390039.1 A/G-specific adenine glycosylase [Pseudomonadota bacterium]MBU1545010.1 A/G-specific adenine glycosylase [Pseudomonadota bacterium]MBU2480386.1 A/G-specific adenine glycosylase [Pseudomonadota bacterium]
MINDPEHILTFQQQLTCWYRNSHRKLPWRESKNPYHVWISEVMLQQTQVKTVLPYFFNFIEKFPTIRDLADADLEIVLKMWEGLGYYARARNFHKAANIVSKEFNGHIPDNFQTFLTLPGVGDYIGSAVLSIVFSHPLAVVDGNVKRVLARLFCLDHPVNASSSHPFFKAWAQTLLDKTDPGTFNQAVMELGAMICTPKKTQCSLCPVSEWCNSFTTHTVNDYPKRVTSRPVPTYHIAAGVVQKNKKILITRRKLDGLLGGLWEFPGGKLKKDETAKDACIREIKEETGITVTVASHLTTVHHAYTHFKIIMDVFYCRFIQGKVHLNGPIDYRWVSVKELNNFAFPKANLKFIPYLE